MQWESHFDNIELIEKNMISLKSDWTHKKEIAKCRNLFLGVI